MDDDEGFVLQEGGQSWSSRIQSIGGHIGRTLLEYSKQTIC